MSREPADRSWVTKVGYPEPARGALQTLHRPMPAPEPLPEPEPEAEP